MRVDKFLKSSRLVKRRTVAKEICDQGRVKINDHVCKAGAIINIGDQLTLTFGQKELTIQVEQLLDSVRKEKASELYKVISEVVIK